jgi:hypothetical protein
MHSAGFEPAVPKVKWPQTYSFDPMATVCVNQETEMKHLEVSDLPVSAPVVCSHS